MKPAKAIYPTTKQIRDLYNGDCNEIILEIKPQPSYVIERGDGKTLRWFGKYDPGAEFKPLDSPFGVPADDRILYVRESYLTGYEFEDDTIKLDENDEYIDKVWYRATDVNLQWYSEGDPVETPPWKSSRTMPKTIARFWLKPTEVRVGLVPINGESKWSFIMNFDIIERPS